MSIVWLLSACSQSDGESASGDTSTTAPTAAPSATSSTPQELAPESEPVSASASVGGIVRYVNPSSSVATDSGAGSAAAPFKSLAYAVRQLQPGDTLLIAAGTYREMLDLRLATGLRNGTSTARTRIAAASGAIVMIKGSDLVTGWEWVRPNVFVRRNWHINSQQVFVDSVALQQIGGTIYNGYPTLTGNPYASILAESGGIWPGRVAGNAASLPENSFYYDSAAHALYVSIRSESLYGRTIEASTRQFAVFGDSLRNVTLENLRVQHSNTSAQTQNGAVTLLGDQLILENIQVSNADGAGFDIAGTGNILRNVVATYCGQVGVKMRGQNGQLLNALITYNNTRGFNKWWEAGGAKFVGAGGLQNSLVSGNRVLFNRGDGLWFDTDNTRNNIRTNVVAYNTGMGVHYEASNRADIVRNQIFGNGQRGIYLPNSSTSVIAHNLVVANGLEGIAIVDERRAFAQNNTALIPTANYVAGNVIAWNGKSGLVLPELGINAASDANLYIGPQAPTFSNGWASPINPLAVGLNDWIGRSGHDINSWSELLALPLQLSADLTNKVATPDFAAVHAIAARYAIPRSRLPAPVPAAIGSRPGPQ
jgi:parallel beta-helix repeat protein